MRHLLAALLGLHAHAAMTAPSVTYSCPRGPYTVTDPVGVAYLLRRRVWCTRDGFVTWDGGRS